MSDVLPAWNSIQGKPYSSSDSGSSPSGQRARRLEAERVGEPARRGGRARVVEREAEAGEVVGLARGRVAPAHPGAEPRGRHRDERRAAAIFAALGNRRLEPDDRAGGGRVEAHVDRDVVERALPGHAPARLPHGDAGKLEPLAALGIVHLEDPPANPGSHRISTSLPRVVRVDRSAHPPQVELVGERREGGQRVRRYLDHGRAGTASLMLRLLPSTCRLNDASCSSPAACSSSSQSRSERDRLRPEPEDPRPRIVGWALVDDDSRLQQDAKVPAHRRCGGAGRRGELARAARALAEELNDALAGRVAKRCQERSELLVSRS